MKRVKTKLVVNLPTGSNVLVKKGMEVVADQVLAEVKLNEEKIVNIGINLEKFKDVLIGRSVKIGEVIAEIGSLFKKKILSTVDGTIDKIDEYNNIYFKLTEGKNKKILSQTEATVVEIDDESITLEFKAIEYKGEGLAEGRVWGKNGIIIGAKLTDLSVGDEGKILMVDELNPTTLAKAEVVGVTGVIVNKGDKIKSRLPILKVEVEEYGNILSEVGRVKRAMLNANSGRLLLVI